MNTHQREWEQLVRLLRAYALRKYGELPTAFSLDLPRAGPHREPLPDLGYEDLRASAREGDGAKK